MRPLKPAESELRNRGYGQCWTLNIESDAMWRIYSPDKNGVKIQTKIRKLFQSLYSAQTSYGTLSCFIGKVDYYPKEKIDKLVEDRLTGKERFDGSIGQARSLLFKRNAFKHENEVRLIYLHPRNQSDSNVYLYHCDPLSLIDRITFDPTRWLPWMADALWDLEPWESEEEFDYEPYFKKLEALGFRGGNNYKQDLDDEKCLKHE
ncbi:MAG: DUF2971 domain-containing protein [Desulfobacteraceae bacterium]|jgi:hypothetical protein